MRAAMLRVHGFGGLHEREFRLAPGMTFVHGPNESGKSTLHAALTASLFGLVPAGRRTPSLQASVERFRPWRHDRYATTIELQSESGRRLRLDWDFSRWTFAVTDAATGADLSSQLGGGTDPDGLCRALYGIARGTYLRVACVRQAELTAIGDSARVREEIDRLAGEAEHAGPERALDALRAERARLVGRNRSRTNPLPRAEALVGELERELADAEQARAGTEAAAAERDHRLTAVTELEKRIAELEATLAAARAAELRSTIARAEAAAQAVRAAEAALAEPPATPPPAVIEQLIAARQRIAQLDRRLAEAEPRRRRAAAVAEAAVADGVSPDRPGGAPRAGWVIAAVGLAVMGTGALLGAAAVVAGAVLLMVGLVRQAAAAQTAGERTRRVAAERSRAAAEARAAAAEARTQLAGLDTLAAELAEARGSLAELLGPGEGDLLERADAQCARARAAERARRTQEGAHGRAQAELESLLRDRSLEALRAQLAALGDASGSGRAGDAELIDRELRHLRDRREQELVDVGARAATLDERLRALPDAAALLERLRGARAERDRLQHVDRVLRVAESELAEAMAETYRDFAPRLNAALERHLARVTCGRYRTAYVGDDLSVRLEAPETGAPVSLEHTSVGTQRLAQLVLRLELVRLLAPSGEPLPVLLDDPFAHLDRARLADAVGLLGEIAADRQLVVFTTQPEAVELAPAGTGMIDLGEASSDRIAAVA